MLKAREFETRALWVRTPDDRFEIEHFIVFFRDRIIDRLAREIASDKELVALVNRV